MMLLDSTVSARNMNSWSDKWFIGCQSPTFRNDDGAGDIDTDMDSP